MVLNRLRFASHIDNLNGAKPVIIKFNSAEPKVKYNCIKYTCMWQEIYRMQSPCGLASCCLQTDCTIGLDDSWAGCNAMVKGFNVCLSEPFNWARSVGGNSRQVNSYWKGQGRGSMPQILSFEDEMICDHFGKLIDTVAWASPPFCC